MEMPKPLEALLPGAGDTEEKKTRRHDPPWPLMASALPGTLMPGSHLDSPRPCWAFTVPWVSQVSTTRLREVEGVTARLHCLMLFKLELKPSLLILSASFKQKKFL